MDSEESARLEASKAPAAENGSKGCADSDAATAVPDPRDRRKGDRRSGERRSGPRRKAKPAGEGAADGTERRSGDRRAGDRRSGDRRRAPAVPDPYRAGKRSINEYPLEKDELEFINAINAYKTKHSRPFPTWSEVLHVLRALGYRKR